MEFYINQNSELPVLEMELINNGLKDYKNFVECIQDAEITFSMYNKDTNVFKVANEKAYIRLKDNTQSCVEEYLICYDWRKRDTKEKGIYIGYFNIKFNGNIISEIDSYPTGELIMPIRQELIIIVK